MFIQNVSYIDIQKGDHYDPGWNSMLIQIVDPAFGFPTPKHQFLETHQFEFLDWEEGDFPEGAEFAITDYQAESLVILLRHAFMNQMNVIVHCHAGVCRSGAVAEVGVRMGFNDSEVYRAPNSMVLNKLMRQAGLSGSWDD